MGRTTPDAPDDQKPGITGGAHECEGRLIDQVYRTDIKVVRKVALLSKKARRNSCDSSSPSDLPATRRKQRIPIIITVLHGRHRWPVIGSLRQDQKPVSQ